MAAVASHPEPGAHGFIRAESFTYDDLHAASAACRRSTGLFRVEGKTHVVADGKSCTL